MVWQNPPVFVNQFAIQIALCAAWQAVVAPAPAITLHYPTSNPTGSNGQAPDPLPHGLITLTNSGTSRFAEGAQSLPEGVLDLMIYVSASGVAGAAFTTGQIEQLALDLVQQLMAQPTAIPFGKASIGMASDPTPGSVAADDATSPSMFRSILITIPFGYQT